MCLGAGLECRKDDYYVIVYKLLSYLYSCLKNCIPVDVDNLREIIKVDIKDPYWEYIILELYKDGYIDGVMVVKYIGDIDEHAKIARNLRIKPKGIDFLDNNSRFNKIREALKEAGEVLFWL